jgi:hypothetical protein
LTFLLDVNVLIALVDPSHVAHDAAHAWFEAVGCQSWATCPLTENGVIRIVSNPKYPNSAGTPDAAAAIVRTLRALPGHVFWADDISLVDAAHIDTSKLATSAQVTDTYLLALAATRGGQLATFDRRLATAAVKAGKSALCIIGNN